MRYRTAKATGMYAGELALPADVEKAMFFGPSMSLQTVNLTGVETRVTLWVGGQGLDKDRKWGEPITFNWSQPNTVERRAGTQYAKLLLRQQFEEFRRHYSDAVSKIIISMLEDTMDGHVYKRSFSREEAEGFSHE